MELDGRGHEVLGDLVVERHLKADQLGQHGLNPLVEGLKVAAHDVRVDVGEHLGRGERRRERAEVALHAILDVERARGWVHGRDHQRVVDALHAEALEVIEAAVVFELVQKRNGRLVAVLVGRGHVEVVDEIDELLDARRAEDGARLLLKRRFEHHLQRRGDGERVERDDVVHPHILVEAAEQHVGDHRLGGARVADVHDRLLELEHRRREPEQSRRVERGHEDASVRLGAVVRVPGHDLTPVGAPLGLPLFRGRVDVIVEDAALVGEAHSELREFGAPVAVELLAEVGALVGAEGAADTPHGRKLEEGLVHLPLRAGRARLGREHRLEDAADDLDDPEVLEGRHVIPLLLLDHRERGRDERVEELLKDGLRLGVAHRLDPHRHVRAPADIALVEEDAASARGGRRRRVAKVRDLKQQLHRLGQRDALVGGERQDAIVVHHSIHRLDPLGVDVAVEHHPLGHIRVLVIGRHCSEVAHNLGDYAVVRLLGHRVHVAVELVGGDGLRVEWIVQRVTAAHGREGLRRGERLP